MVRYMLDTSVLIDMSKSAGTAASTIRAWIEGPDEVGVCAVQVAEFYRGIAPILRSKWETFFSLLQFWDIPPDAAVSAGLSQYEFDCRGKAIGTADALIAAAAIAHSAILVTNNVRDFPMGNVTLLSLRPASSPE